MQEMNRAAFGGIELEYEVRGAGEHVVLVHHGAGADWFNPLFEEPALAGRFRLLRYHRAGLCPQQPTGRGRSLFERRRPGSPRLMRHLGIGRAHLVGHSASACIALQIAAGCSRRRPLPRGSRAGADGSAKPSRGSPSSRAVPLRRHQAAPVETFLRGTCGPNARAVLEKKIPGAIDQAFADADTFFRHELPALRQWSFGPEEARAYRSRSSPCSAKTAIHGFIRDRNCCSNGCRTSSRSC